MKIALLLSVCWGFVCFGCGGEPSIQEQGNSRPAPKPVFENTDSSGHHHPREHGPHGGPQAANDMMAQSEFEELLAHFESDERASWQKPDSVVALLGDIENKVVVDLGAGSGYFAFRLLEAGAHVIAAEVDDRFIKYLSDKRDSMEISDLEFDVRKVFFDDPLLNNNEADVFFTVDTYHHIERRVDYLKKVFKGMRTGGKLVVVDFKKEASPHGPPKSIRLHPDIAVREAKQAGFAMVEVDTNTLPEQYILQATKPEAP